MNDLRNFKYYIIIKLSFIARLNKIKQSCTKARKYDCSWRMHGSELEMLLSTSITCLKSFPEAVCRQLVVRWLNVCNDYLAYYYGYLIVSSVVPASNVVYELL